MIAALASLLVGVYPKAELFGWGFRSSNWIGCEPLTTVRAESRPSIQSWMSRSRQPTARVCSPPKRIGGGNDPLPFPTPDRRSAHPGDFHNLGQSHHPPVAGRLPRVLMINARPAIVDLVSHPRLLS